MRRGLVPDWLHWTALHLALLGVGELAVLLLVGWIGPTAAGSVLHLLATRVGTLAISAARTIRPAT